MLLAYFVFEIVYFYYSQNNTYKLKLVNKIIKFMILTGSFLALFFKIKHIKYFLKEDYICFNEEILFYSK